MKKMTTEELRQIQTLAQSGSQEGKQWLILDVREPDEYGEAHIEGSLNIPVDSLEARSTEIPKTKQIAIHCRSGKRAQRAVETLTKLGFNNLHCVADGGMLRWNELGLPVVK